MGTIEYFLVNGKMRKLRILLVHNYYQQSGGEDAVFASEKSLLVDHGHAVFEYTDSNKRIESLGYINSAVQTIWSRPSYNAIKRILQDVKPDIAHFHNTFMLISPSVYYACAEVGVPIIQTLHNYRLLCPNAYLFRDGAICEECINLKNPLPGVFHKCYRNSHSQSAVVAGMLGVHRLIRTWQNKIDFYITLTEFARNKFVQGGLPPEKLVVKPNFLPTSNVQSSGVRNHVLYAGRLSHEKGIQTLGQVWRGLSLSSIPLYIAGDGPEREVILQLELEKVNVRYLGKLDSVSLDEFIIQSRFVVIPSVCYENFPMSILDSFRLGVPVIASRIGSLVELIRDGETGLLFNPGDAADLAAKVNWLWNHLEESERMGRAARLEYEQKYTPERNHQLLMEIYERAIKEKKI